MSFLQLPGRRRSCHPGHFYMCLYDTKAKHKATLLTATRKLENIFPSLPSRLVPLLSPEWRMCALTFAGINLLVYLDFPSLICLNEINGHSKFIPNWNCHYWVSQQTELTQSETPPIAITDSIILS